MDDLSSLYQDLLLDHCRHPRHFGKLDTFTHQAEGFNPMCGDEINIFVKLDDQTIQQLQFTGQGCAISVASASLMSENLQGKSVSEAKTILSSFLHMLTDENAELNDELGKLQVLYNVRNYPIRIKCATLAWHAFLAAIEQNNAKVTTEQP